MIDESKCIAHSGPTFKMYFISKLEDLFIIQQYQLL